MADGVEVGEGKQIDGMVQKWPEINGRQFNRTDGRTDFALGLGEGRGGGFQKI